MKNKGIRWLLHLLFWGATAWFILTAFAIVGHEVEMINDTRTVRVNWDGNVVVLLSIVILLSAGLFYFNLWNIARLREEGGRWRTAAYSIGALLACILLYTAIVRLPHFVLYPQLGFGLVMSILLFYLAVSFGYGISRVWLTTESQRRQLFLEKKQTELDLLRQQLQPHFLFNVLNNLLAMVDHQKDPALATAIDRLSGLLRHVVYDSAQEQISLTKELDFIRHYAELQLLRFEAGEVDFRLDIDGLPDRYTVEPGIFLPFVENAFKHGAAPEEHSFVHLYFDLRQPQQIIFKGRNSVWPELKKEQVGGSGLTAIRKRLQLVYPDAHQLLIDEENEAFTVELTLIPGNINFPYPSHQKSGHHNILTSP
ncbi:MAG: histidine kinase [Saprospiraceae bacterium]|nr:histidine kinase [Lewinella sp.]